MYPAAICTCSWRCRRCERTRRTSKRRRSSSTSNLHSELGGVRGGAQQVYSREGIARSGNTLKHARWQCVSNGFEHGSTSLMLKAHHHNKHPRRPRYLQVLLLLLVAAYLGANVRRPPPWSHSAPRTALGGLTRGAFAQKPDSCCACVSVLVQTSARGSAGLFDSRLR